MRGVIENIRHIRTHLLTEETFLRTTMEHTTDYKMYNQDTAIKAVDKLDINMSWVQDPKDVQTDRCAIALLEHNAPQRLAFNDKV